MALKTEQEKQSEMRNAQIAFKDAALAFLLLVH